MEWPIRVRAAPHACPTGAPAVNPGTEEEAMRKTDLQLQRDVLAELAWEPSIDAAQIGVASHGGVITLSGHVSAYREKIEAERAAKRVHGVHGVANELRVSLPAAATRDDTELTEAIVRALRWNVAVPDDRITVTVDDGWVTLEGRVDMKFQREAAYRAVRELTGVKGLTSRIAVTPPVTAENIREKIGAAFARSARLDAQRITVDTEGSRVILRGNVSTWTEHDEAAAAAWAAPGVTSVVNFLTVQEETPAFM
jgi:osmotically-inducible protein OsmY